MTRKEKGGLWVRRRDVFKAAGFAALVGGVVAGDSWRPREAAVVSDRTRFVSPVGSDARDGRSWATAKGTLQDAYDSLGENDNPHGGLVWVDFGDYDVGPGLALHRDKPAVFRGVARPGFLQAADDKVASCRIRSSSGAAVMVTTDDPNGLINAFGMGFENLAFIATHVEQRFGIVMKGNGLVVDNCLFAAEESVDLDGWVGVHTDVDPDRNDDASWARITNCATYKAALCRLGQNGRPGENSNRHFIANNSCFGRGTHVATPLIEFGSNHGTVFLANHLENAGVGYRLTDSWDCVEAGSAGESVQLFLDLYGCTSNLFMPTGISYPGQTQGVKLVRGDAGTSGNTFVLASIGGASQAYDRWKHAVSLASADNLVLTSDGIGWPGYGAGATLGKVTGKVPVHDCNGAVKGYLPVYDSIT